jgi:hypothetical protein
MISKDNYFLVFADRHVGEHDFGDVFPQRTV